MGSLKWVLIAGIVFYLFRDRLFGRTVGVTGAGGVVVRPDPLYGPTPGPNYAIAPPTPAIGVPPTNVYDTISAGIHTAGDVISGYLTGDN